MCSSILICVFFLFQAEDGIRDLVRSRGLGDVYKRQFHHSGQLKLRRLHYRQPQTPYGVNRYRRLYPQYTCLLYTSDAADERSSVDLGGRRILKKKK